MNWFVFEIGSNDVNFDIFFQIQVQAINLAPFQIIVLNINLEKY
jgi:hypothetical protein